mmetsp:Transcript_23465/g.72706  ORF Transcript_23465/g.72706 Transcript_23465/m.72706 type:complete len:298 (-) Transcript_23465:135-1028(-)|eukprot:CAMPEP_0174828464 /NCGR_PEP_ID=MMETSP1114-20130205/1349_1 /TAXON_ID=312471 /ORGANISM="Neobodo designis, Strain CCAP 1951/1" /LENGTH=297 /DNA_ID=CAMNT_0016062183 /DNA_START=229 /DNA_END=1122 /DNA_ORIENTATION=-
MSSEQQPGTTSSTASMAPTIPAEAPPQQRRPSGVSAAKSAQRIIYDALGHVIPRAVDPRSTRRSRPLFVNTPSEREVNRVSRNGRALSELEILQEKHEPEFRQIVPVIADVLSACVDQHTELARSAPRDQRFVQYETNAVPGIQIEDYVHRLAEYTYISPASLVAACIFLDRLCMRHSTLLLTNLNVFKLFFVAVRVSSKVVELRTLNNKNFASVGGISNRHLNDLEAKFLIDMRFDLCIQPREFFWYAQKVIAAVPGQQRPEQVPRPMPRPGTNGGNPAASGSREPPTAVSSSHRA